MTEKSEFITATQAAPPRLDLDALLVDLDAGVAELVTTVISTVDLYNADIVRIGQRAVELDLVRSSQVVDGVAYLPGSGKARGLWISGDRVAAQPDVTTTITRAAVFAAQRAMNEARL